MKTSQKIGLFGLLTLGTVCLIGAFMISGFSEPVHYFGGISLLMLAGIFMLDSKAS
jgi:preprotein translocase subunit SecY